MSKPRFLALAHLKGGTGATTVAVGLAAGLALKRRSVVLLDLDPIGAATFSLLAETPARGLAECLEGRAVLADVLVDTAVPGLRLAAASPALAAWDRKPERFPVDLARVLGQVPAGVQDVILDLPPSAGAIVRGALAVLPGGEVLAPVQTRALDLVGFSELVQLIRELAEQNQALHLAGVVPVRVNRTALSGEVLEALRQGYGKRVLPGIRDATAAARAPFRHAPVQLTASSSPVAADFAALVRAVLHLEE
jgi:chromosome partitioning protein